MFHDQKKRTGAMNEHVWTETAIHEGFKHLLKLSYKSFGFHEAMLLWCRIVAWAKGRSHRARCRVRGLRTHKTEGFGLRDQ